MHLLNVDTLQLETFYDTRAPKYAILSHTWGKGEVTFTDIQHPRSPGITALAGFEKIRKTCAQAKADHYQYVWIDTCCIDKSSSAELSEAINSMFQWYLEAGVCYAYLSDVIQDDLQATFPNCRWFSRGWTLQELLAPSSVKFYDRDWLLVGTKRKHAKWLSNITGIDLRALSPVARFEIGGYRATLDQFCIAKRMSWAARRETTRVEDIAYCLFGIFNVNMPLLYGEREKAFMRLQEELLRTTNDHSIFAWDLDLDTRHLDTSLPDNMPSRLSVMTASHSVLASSPTNFVNCCGMECYTRSTPHPLTMTSAALQVRLPLIPVHRDIYQKDGLLKCWIALLNCGTDPASEVSGILLWAVPNGGESSRDLRVAPCAFDTDHNGVRPHAVRLGPQSVLQAKQTTMTIVRPEGSGTLISHFRTCNARHYALTTTSALREAGWAVSGAFASSVELDGTTGGKWNESSQVLTLWHALPELYVLSFEFTRRHTVMPGFTVIVKANTNQALVCQGASLPRAELVSFWYGLNEPADQTRPPRKQDSHVGRIIDVSLRDNTTTALDIVEVHVDMRSDDANIEGARLEDQPQSSGTSMNMAIED